jgi:hypothetical protein
MVKANTEGKNKILLGIVAFIAIISIISFIGSYFFIHYYKEKAVNDYYKNQVNVMCNLSNVYRNITIYQNPEIENEISPALNCPKYSLEELGR